MSTPLLKGHACATWAIIMLAGCAPQAPAGASAIPQTGAATLRSGARAATGDLLYILDNYDGRKISVFTFPGGKPAGRVLMPEDGGGSICSDAHGHVFIPADGVVFEYAHGGKIPIATLHGISYPNHGCAGDPKTGNLAVITDLTYAKCTIEIYKAAKGNPVAHSDPRFQRCDYPTYDDRGNLFFDGSGQKGSVLAELPAGSSKFITISLSESIPNIFFMQSDGEDIAIQARELGSQDLPVVIFRTHVVGTKGTVVAKIRFQKWTRDEWQFSIQGDEIVAQSGTNELGIWKYPQGGKLLESFPHAMPGSVALTVSVE